MARLIFERAVPWYPTSGLILRVRPPFTTVYAAKFTTTGVGTFSGLTLAAGENVGLASQTNISFNAPTSGGVVVGNQAGSPTSGNVSFLSSTGQNFAPSSGSANFGMFHLNPIINGVSSGCAVVALIASQTNVLTNGCVKFLSMGCTSSDGFSGFTERFGFYCWGWMDMRAIGGQAFINNTPPGPGLNSCTGRIYFTYQGTSKCRMMVAFPTGAHQQVAVEP